MSRARKKKKKKRKQAISQAFWDDTAENDPCREVPHQVRLAVACSLQVPTLHMGYRGKVNCEITPLFPPGTRAIWASKRVRNYLLNGIVCRVCCIHYRWVFLTHLTEWPHWRDLGTGNLYKHPLSCLQFRKSQRSPDFLKTLFCHRLCPQSFPSFFNNAKLQRIPQPLFWRRSFLLFYKKSLII